MFFSFIRKLQRNRELKKLKEKKYSFLFEPYDGDEVVVFDTEIGRAHV